MQRWSETRNRLLSVLGDHFHERLVWDPVSPEHKDAIDADLADVLAMIYVSLSEQLALYDLGEDLAVEEAIWQWRFGWESGVGWGRQVTEALPAIFSLVHSHYDEDEGRFDNDHHTPH